MDRPDLRTIAACLRCSAQSTTREKCENCPYAIEEILPKAYEGLAEKWVDGKPVAVSCDVDRMAMDAADALEECLKAKGRLELNLISRARASAILMNDQEEQHDVERNHANYGAVNEALHALRFMGHETSEATWENNGCLICERIEVDGKRIYTRYDTKENEG